MPILEDLKGYAERATGLRRPGKRKAMELARMRKPHIVRFKEMVLCQITRAGRSLSIEEQSLSMTAKTPRP
ncbi:hypothetical protein [Bradyrhizobium sp. 143]|uniref:hypothetical protein n=1 Tax=unclassified Bradyrhizobium TaxID=2631580 RepID=UPI003208BD02